MHTTFLDALRHREQDIVRFLAILGPALGGFIWLLGADVSEHPIRFTLGSYGVLFVLVMGAIYSLALGYNFRYLTLQLAKLESEKNLNLKGAVLTYWLQNPENFEEQNHWKKLPWRTPPEIIKVFWIAFLVCLAGVSIAVCCVSVSPQVETARAAATPALRLAAEEAEQIRLLKWLFPWVGLGLCLALAILGPIQVGRKMLKLCREEDHKDWPDPEPKTE
jgi:hypothetical protein